MEFKITSSIKDIKRDWKSIVDSEGANVYRTYEYYELLYKIRKSDPLNILRKNRKCIFVVAYDKGVAKAIAPLIFDNYPYRAYRMLGHGASLGSADFIYNDRECARELLHYIKENVFDGGYPFEYLRIHPESILLDELPYTMVKPAYKAIIDEYDAYYGRLSKKEKSNVKHAYNRLKVDGVEWRFVTYKGGDISVLKELPKVVDIYYHRLKKWQKRDWDYSWLRKFYFAARDIVFVSLLKIPSARLHLMYINGEIAYFVMLFKCGNTMYIPHAALNERFSRYSPGMLLHSKLIKMYSENGPIVYDMGLGNETYKERLGGEEYKLYFAIFNQ